jgi:hypothetical protein
VGDNCGDRVGVEWLKLRWFFLFMSDFLKGVSYDGLVFD